MNATRLTPDLSIWTGRVDHEEQGDARRWHQIVQPMRPNEAPGIALIGFACDAGVRRNLGRPGAVEGPRAIRRALAGLAAHLDAPLYDAGDVVVPTDGDDLEAGQDRLAEAVAAILDAGHRAIVLGGGHEVAWGSHRGLVRHVAPGETIGIVNLDAHFDLRAGARGSSGTPFRQIADDAARRGAAFRYLALGINPDANTAALFDTACRLGADWRLDEEMNIVQLADIREVLAAFIASLDHLHLSIDLDVLPAAVMPGVSAPAARGVGLDVIEPLIADALTSGKLRLADVAELNPAHDPDGRSARVAARLISRLSHTRPPSHP